MKLIPNLLSAARLGLAPYLFLVLWRHQYDVALAVCFLAGLTDALDGFVARWFEASSKIGAYLDPIADKILLSGAFLTLALDHTIRPWLAGLVLGRDVLILLFAGGAFALTARRRFSPSIWGKASTASQIIYVFWLLVWLCGWADIRLVQISEAIMALLTAWSGIHYAVRELLPSPSRELPLA